MRSLRGLGGGRRTPIMPTPINAKDEEDASHLVRRFLLVLLIWTMAPRRLVVGRAMV
jgi:hypothetical protein